jgi:hypothetical protein
MRIVQGGLFAVGFAVCTVMSFVGCAEPDAPAKDGTSELATSSPTTTTPVVPRASPTEVDLLLVVDDSATMHDKSALLAQGAKELVDGLVAAGKSLHVAVITTSLGTTGGDACASDASNRRAHPFTNQGTNEGTNEGVAPVLASATLGGDLGQHVADRVAAIQTHGCGFEQSLEAPYRFLIDPAPPVSFSSPTETFAPPIATGLDEELLAARAAFLRTGSRVVVVTLSDEDDGSIAEKAGPEHQLGGYLATTLTTHGFNGPFRMPAATAACATDPTSPACTSCALAPASCAAQRLSAEEDNFNLRAWDQKRRFGIDFLQPLDRYVAGYTASMVVDRAGQAVPNPLFADGQRTPADVLVASVVGVPWQDLAIDPHDAASGLRPSVGAGAIDWSWVVGSDAVSFAPGDPAMRPTVAQRTGDTLITGETLGGVGTWNSVNGHDWNTDGSSLQLACVSALASPRAPDAGLDGEPCVLGSPLCERAVPGNPLKPGDGTFGTDLVRLGAYPGLRHLELSRRLGAQSVAGSICTGPEANPTKPGFGYRPFFAHLRARILAD